MSAGGDATAGGGSATVHDGGNGNADSSSSSHAVSVGGDAKGNGNGGSGGDGGDAFIAKASLGGDVSSRNSADVSQTTVQAIVPVSVAVQHASADYSALDHS